ncbi:MAG: hydroxyisourate hydrolase [Paracoccaceae bacterium]|nr:hydroxyisourate hydrolase [Paracoccaceae bacterium]
MSEPEQEAVLAAFSTHVLDGTDGTHAAGVAVSVTARMRQGGRRVVLTGSTGPDGRFSGTFDLPVHPGGNGYETGRPNEPVEANVLDVSFEVGRYFARHQAASGRRGGAHQSDPTLVDLVFRVAVADPDGHFHLPVILSPHSCSAWCSG